MRRLVGRLAEIGYAVEDRSATTFDGAVRQSVYAFQKAQEITVILNQD